VGFDCLGCGDLQALSDKHFAEKQSHGCQMCNIVQKQSQDCHLHRSAHVCILPCTFLVKLCSRDQCCSLSILHSICMRASDYRPKICNHLVCCVTAGMRVSMSRSSSRSGRPDSVQSLKPPVPRAGTAAGNVRPARQRSCSVGRRRVTS